MLQVRAVYTVGPTCALTAASRQNVRTPYYCKGLVARSRQCNGGLESPSSHRSVLLDQKAQGAAN
jgi:hypothetical protein